MSNTFSPAMMGSQDARTKSLDVLSRGRPIIVIGAGAFGGWSALFLLRQGYKVTLIDAWGPGHARASSGGETRLIRCIYGDNLFYTQLAARSYEIWMQEQNSFRKQVLHPRSCLWLVNDASKAIMESAKRCMSEAKLPLTELTAQESRVRFPLLQTEDLESVLIEHQAGYLLARESCVEVKRQFVKEGGSYRTARACPQISDDGCMLKFADGSSMHADRYLFACGPWHKALFPDLLGPHIHVTRQEVFYFGVPAQLVRQVSTLPLWIDHTPPNHYYGVPSGVRRGFKIASDRRGHESDPEDMTRVPTEFEINSARNYIQHRFPGLGALPLLEARVCQYSNTPDANFFFDHHPSCPEVLLLGGGSGHGFKHGPALGLLVAECISGACDVPSELLLPNEHQ